MLMEKMTALIKKDNKNNKRKIENLVFALILLVITLITINIIFKDKPNKNNNLEKSSSEININTDTTIENDIEKKLEEILSNIKGVDDVKVLITYSETEKLVPLYNENSSQSTTEETDTEGATRTIESYNNSKEIVSDSSQTPITEKTILPKIEGAIITAKGVSDSNTKEKIINAVEAATGLASHKIQVFEAK